MKKILRRGNRSGYKFIGKCVCCDCEFEYEEEDIANSILLVDRYVTCPECGASLRHSDQNECSMNNIDTMML